ncbi:MAG: sulfite exporter TauE/SafE family protein [Beijerinckiaceae bacterium]
MAAVFDSLSSVGITQTVMLVFLLGFVAQAVDGALGMAFGVLSSTGLMVLGVHPAAASAIVHTAEIATTGAAGASHAWFRNVDWQLFRRLAISGVVGGVIGALVLSNINGRAIQPFVAAWLLLMGAFILLRAFRMTSIRDAQAEYAAPLGLVGGFLDAVGGGGWGPMVSSTLIGSGHAPRKVIGTVSASEFCVTFAISIAFFTQIGLSHIEYVLALIAGGLLAAPFGALVARRVPTRPLMFAVGGLVCALAMLQLKRLFV